MIAMNMEQLKEFVCLENRKRDLDAELKGVKAKLDELEEALVPQFIEAGLTKATVDGRTVSLAQEIYASPLDGRERVVEALKASELAQYVSENYNQFAFGVRARSGARCGRPGGKGRPDLHRGGRAVRAAGAARPGSEDLVRPHPAQQEGLVQPRRKPSCRNL
jgi:hypothetical protein